MFQTYQQIFNQRASSYHKAMLQFPHARAEEFEHLIRLSELQDGLRICDIPSGGSYLNQYINHNLEIIAVETCEGFIVEQTTPSNCVISKVDCTGIRNESFHRVLSLAGLHHLENKDLFFHEVHRLLKPEGKFCFADIAQGSKTSIFMDSIVDRHCSMGHEGRYLNLDSLNQIQNANLNIAHEEKIDFFWRFESEFELVEFCRLLFGMDKLNTSLFLKETHELFGLIQNNNEYWLPWQLQFICGSKSFR